MTLPWIKVFTALPTHPKMQHLELLVGARAFDHTVRALLWIAEWRPKGGLLGVRPEVLEAATQWDGEHHALYNAWVEAGFINLDGCRWHDWEDVQVAHVDHSARKQKDADRKRVLRAKARVEASTEAPAGALSDVVRGQGADIVRTSCGHHADTMRTLCGQGGGPIRTSLISDLSSSDQDPVVGIAETVPGSSIAEPINRGRQNPEAPRPRPGRIGTGGVGFMENPADYPKTVEELLEREGVGLAREFPTLNGSGGRPALTDAVRAKWSWYLSARERHGGGHANAMATLRVDLGILSKKFTPYSDRPLDHEAIRHQRNSPIFRADTS